MPKETAIDIIGNLEFSLVTVTSFTAQVATDVVVDTKYAYFSFKISENV